MGIGRLEQLDHRADPELVGLLAAAARMAPARLRAMRATMDDGTASCWVRTIATWCPECVRGDLAQGSETYGRAIWRLGCCVICPDHGMLLHDGCGQCWDTPRCRFRPDGGWLGLACTVCKRLPYKPDQPTGSVQLDRAGAFDVQITPVLAALMAELQRDLQAALLGAAPGRPWGPVRSGALLLRVVRHIAFSIVLARSLRFEQRTEMVIDKGRVPYMTILYEPVTPAALPPCDAFGMLAITGAVLDSLGRDGNASHTWRPGHDLMAITVPSFVEWLGADGRRWLREASRHWSHPVGAAFGADQTSEEGVAPKT